MVFARPSPMLSIEIGSIRSAKPKQHEKSWFFVRD